MHVTWSPELIAETRNVLDLGIIPLDDFVHMKNINGSFGKMGLDNWLAQNWVIQDKRTGAEYFYATAGELIEAGWAVD